MISSSAALNDPIFRAYLFIVPLSLAAGGMALAIVQYGFRRQLGTIWSTYRSWIVMAGIGLVCVALGRFAVITGVALLSIFAFREYAAASDLQRDTRMCAVVYIGIVAVGVAACYSFSHGYRVFMAVPVVVIGLVILVPIIRNQAQDGLQKIALGVFGFIFIGWMFGHLGLLAGAANSYGLLCYIVFATESADISAFVFGRLFGKHSLRSNISPRKTIEGAVGGLVVAMVLPWALRFSLPFFSATQLVATGLIVGFGGLLGDLTVSVLKRDLGIKDMSRTIPGHGGILDRIDSLIFVAPLFMHLSSCQAGM